MGNPAGSVDKPDETEAKTYWYDREPLGIWLPLAAVAGGTVQTVAYVGYKLFYNSFGVRPEEVGYEYTSLLPRTAFQLALITGGVIAFLGLLSLIAAFYGGMLKPMFDDWARSRRRVPNDSDGAVRAAVLLFVALIAFALAGRIGLHIGLVGLLGLYLTILVAEHAHARNASRAESSGMSALLAPRAYRGSRRLVLIALAVGLPMVDGYVSIGSWVAWTMMLFAIDRILPVVDRGEDYVPGGGRSKWLWRTTSVALIGVVAVGFLALLQVILDASHIDAKVQQVRAGKRLTSSLLDPLSLAEPRADPVLVRWVAPNPPDPFTRNLPSSLTFLGQDGGTAVFLNTRTRPQAVYRFPASALAIEAPSDSILD